MATTTTTGAKKIENSDQWGEIFDIHNDTVDAYDQLHEDTVEDYDDKIDDLSNAMGIVETGDVATHAIEAGQYVIWKRALYTADAAITIGETLAATGGSKNMTAVEKGGLNALNASLSYSTSEQIVGKWINDKQIFRKVFTNLNFGDAQNAWTNTGVSIPGIDQLINAYALSTTNNLQSIMGFKVVGTNIQFYSHNTWTDMNMLIVEYTKN